MLYRTKQLPIAILMVCIVRTFSFTSHYSSISLSSSTYLNAYHFGAGAVKKEKPKVVKYKSYVPDGLSAEEYAKIKETELKKEQAKNYGAWGPRFNQIDGDPDSNWFNLPSLWTTGFNSNSNSLPGTNIEDNNIRNGVTAIARMIVTLRRLLLPYLTLLVSAELLEASLTARSILSPILSRKLLSKYMLIRILIPIIALKPLDLLASKVFGIEDKYRTTKLTVGVGLVMSVFSLVLRQLV